jgi:hypothetical protein
MGLYYSDDERFVICTMDYPPSASMKKDSVDTKAATIIQLWWRNFEKSIENDIATSIVIDSDQVEGVQVTLVVN